MLMSVIIPTCSRNDFLSNCLDRLLPVYQAIDQDSYEIIVSDDDKKNSAKQLIEKKYKDQVTWVSGPKKGPAANRNQGAKYAKGDWLIFIDDDCLPMPELLRSYYCEITTGKYSALEGAIINNSEKRRFDEEAPLNITGGNFWSCNIAIKKETFWDINGFDENFPFAVMEDVDLHRRLIQVTDPHFVAEAKVFHPWRRAVPFKNYKKWLRSNKYYIEKLQTHKDVNFRIVRLKILIAILYKDLRELKKYSFKGTGYYLEKVWFNFLMIFV